MKKFMSWTAEKVLVAIVLVFAGFFFTVNSAPFSSNGELPVISCVPTSWGEATDNRIALDLYCHGVTARVTDRDFLLQYLNGGKKATRPFICRVYRNGRAYCNSLT